MEHAPRRTLVVEDLYRLPDDGRRYELVNGRLVSEPLSGGRRGRIAATIASLIARHVREHRLGVVVTCDTGFVLARGPDTVRGPDVAFINRKRWERLHDDTRAIPGAPDLAIEVLGPESSPVDVHAKVADFLAAGTPRVWVVDPEQECVDVFRTLLEPRCFIGDDELAGEIALPGFRARVATLFQL